MPKMRHRTTLSATAKVAVNAVVWITSPDDDDARQSTEQVLTFLEPFLQIKNITFLKFEPKSAADLFAFLATLEGKVKAGLRPIIHLDTHGGDGDGLYIAASDEFVPWQELVNRLRPINVAAHNNICLVSAACFSLQSILSSNFFDGPTPFFIMLAPQHTVSFGFIEKHTHNFYEDLFAFHDIMGAHERHLAPQLQQYHCHRLLLKALSGYLRDSCTGRGRRKRIRKFVAANLGPGKQHPNTLENRRMARRVTLAAMKPSQKLIDKYVKPFLMGEDLSMSFDEILAFARADAMRSNVLLRRAARGKRRNRRVRYSRRKRLRAIRRR